MRSKIKSLLSSSIAEQHVTAIKIAHELHDKEQKVYKKTKQFKQNRFELSLDYLFYDFQILGEFLHRFHNELNIKIEQGYLDSTLELLGLANRFLEIGHYDVAGGYLRKAFESWIYCLYTGTSTENKKDKLIWIMRQRKSNDTSLSLDENEVYKIYSYLSDYYIHKTDISSDISFNSNKYSQIYGTMVVLVIVMSYLAVDMIPEKILVEYRQKNIINPIDDYKFYAAYIGPLVGSGVISSSKTWFLNGLKYSGIQSHQFKDKTIGLDLNKRIRI